MIDRQFSFILQTVGEYPDACGCGCVSDTILSQREVLAWSETVCSAHRSICLHREKEIGMNIDDYEIVFDPTLFREVTGTPKSRSQKCFSVSLESF